MSEEELAKLRAQTEKLDRLIIEIEAYIALTEKLLRALKEMQERGR